MNIVITYADISGCPKKFVAVTTLHQDEFTEILSYFSVRWRIHENLYTLSNTWWVNKSRRDEIIRLIDNKLLLLFIISRITPYKKLWVKILEWVKQKRSAAQSVFGLRCYYRFSKRLWQNLVISLLVTCPQSFKIYFMTELVFYNLIKLKEMLHLYWFSK